MELQELDWPVLGFRGSFFTLWRDPDAFATQYLNSVTSGYFRDHTIVDLRGRAFRIVEVVPRGVSLLTRFANLLIGQQVAVDVELEPTGEIWTVERTRTAVEREFHEWDGWQSREDVQEVMSSVAEAQDLPRLVAALMNALDQP